MFAKILLCLDGSSLSEQLVPYTAEIAQRFGSRVVLLQVLQMSSALAVASVQGAEYVIEQERRRLSAEAHEYLKRIGAQLKDKGLSAEVVVIEGTPGDAIVEYSKTSAIELIVVAIHGRRNIGQLVFGSVADHVMRNTTIPVLAMKPVELKE